LNIFIFTINQDLSTHKLMDRIMSYDQSLGRKDMVKFILLIHNPI
jgi:hypothetical protein